MKIGSKLRDLGCIVLLVFLVMFLACHFANSEIPSVFADNSAAVSQQKFYVTIHDRDAELTVKTGAATVAEVLERAGIQLDGADIVEPALDTPITSDFRVQIYRTRPVILIDGTVRRYVMSASANLAQIAREAGLSLGPDDTVVAEFNDNFLERGVAKTYRIIRSQDGVADAAADAANAANAAATADVADSAAPANAAAADEFVVEPSSAAEPDAATEPAPAPALSAPADADSSDAPDSASPAPAAETSFVVPAEQALCAEWILAAGVAESDLEPALELIYHESRCQVDATNPSSGAYGIPQALPATRLASAGDDWATNPVTQIRWMADYVTRRYGGWQEALDYWWCTGACTSNLGTITKYNYWY